VSLFPTPSALATVLGQDGDAYRVVVVLEGFAGGQGPTVPVTVLTHGPRDALRIKQPPLPTKGTRGLVLFPRGDPRNGVWIGAVDGPMNDASATQVGMENIDYESHFSGYWRMLDESGNLTVTWPDGSNVSVGSPPAAATRHVVTAGQQRQQVSFAQADRVKSAPGAMPMVLRHASGAQVQVAANGDVSITSPHNVTIVASGAVTINAQNAAAQISIGGTGESLLALMTSAAAAIFNAHQHSGVQPGGGNSGGPTTTIAGSPALTSTLVAG
jgi:hypothetical protein